MFGSVDAFYQSLAAGTRRIASNNMAKKVVLSSAGVGILGHGINAGIKSPRTVADRLYPQTRIPMGSGKYGLGAGGASSDLGAEGLKFSFRKKR